MGKSSMHNPNAAQPAFTARNQSPMSARPRDDVDDFHDQYIPEAGYPEPTICGECGSVYENKSWHIDRKRHDLLASSGVANEVTCPACQKIRERIPQGIVTLKGEFWPQHREEIVNLIYNQEERNVEHNPLGRVMNVYQQDGALIIETTNEKLAQKIGRSIHKAYSGTLDYKWPDGNELVRVDWER